MISQKCPRCASNRIRRGYRPTPIWSKIFFRYYLLCDSCNWEFTGFAVTGTVSAKPTKKRKKVQNFEGNSQDSEEDTPEVKSENYEQADLAKPISAENKRRKSASK